LELADSFRESDQAGCDPFGVSEWHPAGGRRRDHSRVRRYREQDKSQIPLGSLVAVVDIDLHTYEFCSCPTVSGYEELSLRETEKINGSAV
jgi:hypothetical protein